MSGQTIALVPTMGFFHEGHLKLMEVGKKHSDSLMISIFVNPIQFGPAEDLEEYPRDIEGDLSKAEKVGVDIVFVPSAKGMYPDSFQTRLNVERVTNFLCGLSRPGHFNGVTTVVAKLFNIIKPHLAIFGQKDYQQLTVISRMVTDMNMDIQIIGVPTVRESDGLAMSSRNSYLSPEERKSAVCLKKSIDLADDMLKSGERDVDRIKSEVKKLILSYPSTEIDYINICHPVTLEDLDKIESETLLALAVGVGRTKLIDNGLIGQAVL